MLMLCILPLGEQRNTPAPPDLIPPIVAGIVLGIAMSMSANCGGAINPARDLGPRLFTLSAGWGTEVFTYVHVAQTRTHMLLCCTVKWLQLSLLSLLSLQVLQLLVLGASGGPLAWGLGGHPVLPDLHRLAPARPRQPWPRGPAAPWTPGPLRDLEGVPIPREVQDGPERDQVLEQTWALYTSCPSPASLR